MWWKWLSAPKLGKRLCVLLSSISAACFGCHGETLACDNGNQSPKEQIFISLDIDPGTGYLHVAFLFCEMKLMVLLQSNYCKDWKSWWLDLITFNVWFQPNECIFTDLFIEKQLFVLRIVKLPCEFSFQIFFLKALSGSIILSHVPCFTRGTVLHSNWWHMHLWWIPSLPCFPHSCLGLAFIHTDTSCKCGL